MAIKKSEKEYKSGDTAWVLFYPFVIRVKLEPNLFLRKLYGENARLSYKIDEPLGHDLYAEDLFDSLDDAAAAAYKEANEDVLTTDLPSFEETRQASIEAIVNNHDKVEGKECLCGCRDLANRYPIRQLGVDLFVVNPRNGHLEPEV